MEFNCKVKIVDAIMGAGKSQSIINLINNSDEDDRFLVITSYLDEVKRYRDSCPQKKFKAPKFENNKSKLDSLKKLIISGQNICSTHSLFNKFDNDLIEICRAANYTLILDEVHEVIQPYNLAYKDFQTLMTYCDIDENTKQLVWKESEKDYNGDKFAEEKRLVDLGALVVFSGNLMCWLFPVEVFNSFRNIYILTYRFDLQLQRYYYDYYGLAYTYMSVDGNDLNNYHLIPYDKDKKYIKYDYSKLIHICENEKMLQIGDTQTALSKTWYDNNKDGIAMKTLKNNVYNFFNNICKAKSTDNIWTTFKDYETKLRGKGYSKGFLPLNCRATNDYRTRTNVAYTINRYLNPYIKQFFVSNGIDIDEDGYAMSEMLQFLWRSAIREGQEINVYIPSIRMRKLLEQWIKDNPIVE